jgi:hypothetical protein
VDDGMLDDPDPARVALDGSEFTFDVQTHVSTPLTPFEPGSPPDRALDFIKQIFVQSETTVACLTGVPDTRELGAGNVQARTTLEEILDRLAGPRLVFHANTDPENGPAELDYMSDVASRYPVSAWKTYRTSPRRGSIARTSACRSSSGRGSSASTSSPRIAASRAGAVTRGPVPPSTLSGLQRQLPTSAF